VTLALDVVGFLLTLVVFWFGWLRGDHREARWLPWWRRYLPSGLITCAVLWTYAGGGVWTNPFWYAAIAAGIWNHITSRRNKRDGRDHKALEAEAPRLTEVQQQAFGRQVAEARS
jgi:hypothetical protein